MVLVDPLGEREGEPFLEEADRKSVV